MKGLSLDGVALRAGAHGRVLCEALNVHVAPGQCWVLLGANGAGKSTLLATMAGLQVPAQGHIALHGRALDQWSPAELAAERAWCGPYWTDPFPATVAETVALAQRRGTRWRGRDDDSARDADLMTLLQRLDVAELADADVRTLSGGERQRVALAAAWWQGAPLLMLDEPASHLDLSHQELLARRLVEHVAQGGSAVVSVHDLNLAWRIASHAVLFNGRGQASAGTRDEVLTPERLTDAFGVPVAWVEACGERRLWVGALGDGPVPAQRHKGGE